MCVLLALVLLTQWVAKTLTQYDDVSDGRTFFFFFLCDAKRKKRKYQRKKVGSAEKCERLETIKISVAARHRDGAYSKSRCGGKPPHPLPSMARYCACGVARYHLQWANADISCCHRVARTMQNPRTAVLFLFFFTIHGSQCAPSMGRLSILGALRVPSVARASPVRALDSFNASSMFALHSHKLISIQS